MPRFHVGRDYVSSVVNEKRSMNMFSKITMVVAALFIAMSGAWAHALWIKTEATGKKGRKQVVAVLYSEPDEDPEKLADWYSDMKDFELWVVSPDGKKAKLTTTAGEDRFTAEFIPEQDGVYTVFAGKSAKDLGGTTVYQFNASALVAVGSARKGADAGVNGNELVVFADPLKVNKVNSPMKLQTLVNGQKPADKLYVSVHSPSGWSRSIATDENGVAEFTPLWPGNYSIEVSKSWKEAGTHYDKEYKAIWRCATIIAEVKK